MVPQHPITWQWLGGFCTGDLGSSGCCHCGAHTNKTQSRFSGRHSSRIKTNNAANTIKNTAVLRLRCETREALILLGWCIVSFLPFVRQRGRGHFCIDLDCTVAVRMHNGFNFVVNAIAFFVREPNIFPYMKRSGKRCRSKIITIQKHAALNHGSRLP